MLALHDRTAMIRALKLDLDRNLLDLLTQRIEGWSNELLDTAGILIIEPGDTESDIVREIGFSPLIEPIDGIRYGSPGFHPSWDWLARHDGWLEMILTFGSTFAYVLFIRESDNMPPGLLEMCRAYI